MGPEPAPQQQATAGAAQPEPLEADGNGEGGGRDLPGAPPSNEPAGEVSQTLQFAGAAVVGSFFAAAVIEVIATAAAGDGARGNRGAHSFALGIVAVGLLLIHLLGRGHRKLGVFRPIVGKDHRFSTSLTQLGLWTVAATWGFGYLLGRSMFDGVSLDAVMPQGTWDDYLILLGGPFAAAVLAKGVVTYKVEQGVLQKTEATTTTPEQAATDDNGSTDLVDAQYLLFNLIALGYFLIALLSSGQLPKMPGALLALTGSTAALYVGNKVAARNAPTITSVNPLTLMPGGIATVIGTNFDAGADRRDAARRITATLRGHPETIYATSSTNTEFKFMVPEMAEGLTSLWITSSAGVQTTPWTVDIRGGSQGGAGSADEQPPPAQVESLPVVVIEQVGGETPGGESSQSPGAASLDDSSEHPDADERPGATPA